MIGGGEVALIVGVILLVIVTGSGVGDGLRGKKKS